MTIADTKTTRLPNGLTNNEVSSIFANMGQLDPTKYHTYFDDFDGYVLTDGTQVQWTETLNSGTIAQTAVNNGAILMTLANTDEAITQVQRTLAMWLPTAGKELFFKARLKTANVILTDVLVGLAAIDTTLIAASAIGVTDFIGFFKAATDTTFTFYNRLDASTGSTSATSIGTLASDTYYTVSFYYDGVDKVYYAFDDTIVGSVDGSSTYLPNAQLSPSICIGQEGTAGAGTATVDYIFVAQER